MSKRKTIDQRFVDRCNTCGLQCEYQIDILSEEVSAECEALHTKADANTEDASIFAELTTEVLAEVRSQLAGLHRSVEALEAENLSLRAELDRLRITVQGPRLVD